VGGVGEQDEAKTVRPFGEAGYGAGYLEAIQITWADEEHGQGPTGTAIRTGQPVVARNLLTDPHYARGARRRSSAAMPPRLRFPCVKQNKPLARWKYLRGGNPNRVRCGEIQLLAELADDLVYGLSALRARVERKQAEEALFAEQEAGAGHVAFHRRRGDHHRRRAVVQYLNRWRRRSRAGPRPRPGDALCRKSSDRQRQTRLPAPDPVARCLQEGKIVGLANHTC